MKTIDEKTAWLGEQLRTARRILFITGAGISAESGLPTYRGIGGLYNDKLTKDNIPIEEALSGYMMQTRPELTWSYISEIEKACRGAKFNRAHSIIAEMENYFHGVCVLTQNIDGFHRDAGSENVIDIHGDIHNLFCPSCGYKEIHSDYSKLQIPPVCSNCSSTMRPDVILFGEYLDSKKLEKFEMEMREGFDAVFSIGTTSVFPYISRPIYEANMRKAITVEINPSDTEVTDSVMIKIPTGAIEALSKIWDHIRQG